MKHIERWNLTKAKYAENPAIDAFLAEIATVEAKHGFHIGHEDRHGAFIISKATGLNAWLQEAMDATGT